MFNIFNDYLKVICDAILNLYNILIKFNSFNCLFFLDLSHILLNKFFESGFIILKLKYN